MLNIWRKKLVTIYKIFCPLNFSFLRTNGLLSESTIMLLPHPLFYSLQLTLGVFLVGAPLEVWAVWCGLGGLWVIVFLVHECGYLCYKICHRNKDIE